MTLTFSKIMGLDAVELILNVEETFGIAIPDAIACEMTTPAALIAFVQESVKARPDRKACISQRAFHRVRASIMKTTGVPRREITLKTPIKQLFAGHERSKIWMNFKDDSRLYSLPNLGFGSGWLFKPSSVNDLVSCAISDMSSDMREQESWTNEEVRQIVRKIICDQLAIRDFKDTDEFVRDLGLD